jgi:hypothetical protein
MKVALLPAKKIVNEIVGRGTNSLSIGNGSGAIVGAPNYEEKSNPKYFLLRSSFEIGKIGPNIFVLGPIIFE